MPEATPRPPAKAPEALIVRRLMDMRTNEVAWTHPRALYVARDTRELYIDMEYETDDAFDWNRLEPGQPLIMVTGLDDGTVAVELYGDWPLRPSDQIPFNLTDDMRVVSEFTYYPTAPAQAAKKRHPAGKKRGLFNGTR